MTSSHPSDWSAWTEDLRQSLVDILGENEVLLNEPFSSSKSDKLDRPSPEAFDCLEKAIQLDQENSDILFAYCRLLADVLRQNDNDLVPLTYSIVFGTRRHFGNAGHMRNYIFDQCSRLFELDPISLKYNLGVASICSLVLPYWARNLRMAKLCLERALIFHPESGKALTRMGMFKLVNDRDVMTARDYFKKANSYNETDFTAATSLLYSVFEDIQNYKGQVHVLLKTEFQKPFWNDDQRATLYFIRGLFQFFYAGFEKNVAVSWILAFTLNENEFKTCLERFPAVKKKYRFPLKYDDVFTLGNFYASLESSFSCPEVDNEKLEAVRSLIKAVENKHLKEAEEKARALANSSTDDKYTSAGGGYHFGQFRVKKPFDDSYSSLENATIGSLDDVGEAFETFGVPNKTPKIVIVNKYRKICRDLESIKKQPECDQREIANQTFAYNSAFATLHRYFDRQAREAAAVPPDPDDSSDDENSSTSGSMKL